MSASESSVYKRKDGRWVAQYLYEGKPKAVYGKTRKEALDKRKAVMSEINVCREEQIIVEAGQDTYIGITLGEWLLEWLDTYVKGSVRASTYSDYESSIRNHVNPLIGNTRLSSLSVSIFQGFFNERSKTGRLDGKHGGLSQKSLLNIRNMLSSALQQAIDDELIKKNYVTKVRLQKYTRKEMRVLSIEEQRKLIKASRVADNINAFGVILTLFSGVRLGELLALKWSDVDFEKRQIQIIKSIGRQYDIGESSKTKTLLNVSPPKTARGKRTIDLVENIIPLFKHHMEKQKLLHGIQPEPVFANTFGEYLEPRNYQRLFYKLVEKSEIEHTNFHALRHTFATRCIEQGIDVLVLSYTLGHADVSTTLNRYCHLLESHKKESMQKLSGIYTQ